MTTSTNRPRGRRPGHADTRSAIQQAALALFSELGYEKVSLRAVARAAEVDPALIHHYFENKADLFARSVLDMPLDAEALVEEIAEGPRELVGERAVKAFLDTWNHPGGRERFTAMIRAAVNGDQARRPLSEFMSREVFVKVAERMGHPNAKLRAQLAVSLVVGLAMARDVLQLPALVAAKDSVLVKALGGAMQRHLVDPW